MATTETNSFAWTPRYGPHASNVDRNRNLLVTIEWEEGRKSLRGHFKAIFRTGDNRSWRDDARRCHRGWLSPARARGEVGENAVIVVDSIYDNDDFYGTWNGSKSIYNIHLILKAIKWPCQRRCLSGWFWGIQGGVCVCDEFQIVEMMCVWCVWSWFCLCLFMIFKKAWSQTKIWIVFRKCLFHVIINNYFDYIRLN